MSQLQRQHSVPKLPQSLLRKTRKKKDYRSDDSEESCKLRCNIKYLLIAFDSSFQKNLIITLKKQTASPGDAYEDTAFKPGSGIDEF
jgi:hypothetical protein